MRPVFVPTARQFWLRVAIWLFFAAWSKRLLGLDFRTGAMAASFLHLPLLVFHEAGHAIFSFLGTWMTVAGGTLMQLIMPAALWSGPWHTNRDAFGATLGSWFFGVSLLDVAPYVYDALQPRLTLLSGKDGTSGPHDWIFLLSSGGYLPQAQRLGQLVYWSGAAVVVASIALGARVLWRQYQSHFRRGSRSQDS